MPLSIRWRLTLWNALALAVALGAFGALVYALVAHALYAQVDRALAAEAEQLAQDGRLASDPEGRLRYWADEFMEHEKFFCVVYDGRGRVTLHTPELPEVSVPPAPPLGEGERVFGDRTLPAVGRQRVLQARLRAGDRELTVVHLAPLESVDRELWELTVGLVTAIPAAVVLSAALAYLLARKALAPVEQLHRMAGQITAERLDRRLPVAHPGDELGKLAQTINAMIARLERSFAEIRRFTADASHELRTPLTALRTEVEVALQRPAGEVDWPNLLGSVLEECERLARLTEQLLSLAREDSGGPAQESAPLDLGALVAGVVETMRPLAEGKGLRVRLGAGGRVEVRGDGARLRQVFYNLLDNAIKYTPAGGSVEVEVGRESGEAVVRVRDTGVGIPAEHLPRVFDRFYRVDRARGRAEGGTGLGLSIVKSIVTAHGGQIELTSEPGRGTTCTVRLPAGAAQTEPERADRRAG